MAINWNSPLLEWTPTINSFNRCQESIVRIAIQNQLYESMSRINRQLESMLKKGSQMVRTIRMNVSDPLSLNEFKQ